MGRSPLFSRQQPGGMFSIINLREHPGEIFFVGSTVTGASDSAGAGRNPDYPFATLDYAIGQCTANQCDVIYVLPGHAETLSAANAVDIDVAGVKVIGLGWGAARPTFTLDNTAATIRINANSVQLHNVVILGGVDAIVKVLDLNGKTDVVLRDLEYRDSVGQCAIFLAAANNTDRLLIDGLRYIGDSAAGTTRALQFNGCDDLVVRNFDIYGNFSTSAIDFVTTASARVEIYNGRVWTENSADLCIIDTITGSTGSIGPNLLLVLQDNAANITEAVTGATFQLFPDVLVVNLVGEQAMAINWTASTDA